jgi:hypothetical protein
MAQFSGDPTGTDRVLEDSAVIILHILEMANDFYVRLCINKLKLDATLQEMDATSTEGVR